MNRTISFKTSLNLVHTKVERSFMQNYDYSFYLQNIKGNISPYLRENMYFCMEFDRIIKQINNNKTDK